MIQVLALRDYAKNGVTKKAERFFAKNWRFEKVEDVFNQQKLNHLLESVPEDERYNLYFTVADCFEETGRKLSEQHVVPFDIDELVFTDESTVHAEATAVARTACEALEVPFEGTGVIFSGHGVQLFVPISKSIKSEDYFDEARMQYAMLCKRIQNKLSEKGLAGKPDPSVFSRGRLMRLPNTDNRKPGKVIRHAVVLQQHLRDTGFDVAERSGLAAFQKPEHVPDEALKNYPKPDTKAVLAGCSFLRWTSDNQAAVKEFQWYAKISVEARLDNGPELVHHNSAKHPNYSPYETDLKIEQALTASGPRTCKNIETLWDGCKNCPNYEKVTSPIMIKGEDYIASKDFGFRERKLTKDGVLVAGKPAYLDIVKHFTELHPYRTMAENRDIYTFNGKFWEIKLTQIIRAWIGGLVVPAPTSGEIDETLDFIERYNVITMDEFQAAHQKKMNFQNCVLDLATMKTSPHAPEYGFFHVLPFNYDPAARSPRWDKFLMEMTEDAEIAELLKEFGGYCISGDSYWIHKALLLVGTGENGKSVYMETLSAICGVGNSASVALQDMGNPATRYRMYNKLMNYSEETSSTALMRSEVFKTLCAGGSTEYKILYKQPFEAANRTKLILSANRTPVSTDTSTGLHRRLLIVSLKQAFNVDRPGFDYHLKEKLILEGPGICNSLLAAYKNLCARGRFSAEEQTKQELVNYIEASDPVVRFAANTCTLDKDHEEMSLDVYMAYTAYCENNGDKPMNSIWFGRRLNELFPKLTRDKILFQGKRQWVYRGIKLDKGAF